MPPQEENCTKPAVLKVEDRVTVKDATSGEIRQLGRHERMEPWTLMAVLELRPGKPVAVFEDLQTHNGSILYVDQDGIVLELAKTLVPTRVPEDSCYRGHTKEEILASERDILGREILAQGKDPSFEEVAACFPPIRRVRYGLYEGPHTFVGSRNCFDVVPIYYYAPGGAWRVNPLVVAPEIGEVIEQERLWEGLVGGWLPAVHFSYPVREGLTWDSVIFGVVDPPTMYIQPAWYRFLRLENGEVTEAHYIDSYLPYPWKTEPGPEPFYTELYKLHSVWSKTLEGAMELHLPEAWIPDFCRHAMAQEMITRVGNHPRYGVLDRNYGAPEHDGFQDVLNSSVNCYLEWRLFDIAKGYLENYFSDFVRQDGRIDYRGPEIGQYARMLTNLAQYYDYTGNDELLLKYDQKIKAIVRILMTRREEAKKRPKHDPAYGMIAGRHEADISFVTPTLATLDYEQPYFSNSTEAWRGFRDLGRTWIAVGEKRKDPELVGRGQALVEEAAELQEDVYRAIERSILYDTEPPCLPLIAGSQVPYDAAPYRSRPESFDENRVWSEMMHSGMVARETIETILAYCATHKGVTLGIFGNRERVVAFQCYGEAYGLIQQDMIHEFLLFYYTQAAHLHTRGTWSVFECVDMDRDRGEHFPYCAPAQVTIPTVTKWMLVFEDPLSSTLWLAKATPRAWLENGKRISVKNAPTRWGRVSYEVLSQLDEGTVRAKITLPKGLPTAAKLRLRIPKPQAIKSVQVDGKPWSAFDPQEETVSLPSKVVGPIDVEVRCR